MKKSLLFLLILFTFTSCTKDAITTALSLEVIGTFDVTRLDFGGQSYAVPLSSGNLNVDFDIEIAQVSDNQATIQLNQHNTENGTQSTNNFISGTLDLQKNDSGIIEFYENGTALKGTFSNGNLTFNTVFSGENATLHGQKN